MLKVFSCCNDIDFRQLMDVYAQWNKENGKTLYPNLPINLQVLYAEQDFYAFLQAFFSGEYTNYFVWAPQGRYVAALRLEPYLDGLLLEALETAPDARMRGYAHDLIDAVVSFVGNSGFTKIYSHILKDNLPSLSVHYKGGFTLHSEDAVYIDGVHHKDAYTLIYNLNPAV